MKRLLTFVCVVVLVSSCGKRWGAPQREPGSALQVAFGKVTAPQVGELERVGIRELWIEAGTLTWESGRAKIDANVNFEPPRRLSATLVVRGAWPLEVDPETAAEMVRELVQLRVAAEAKGLFANGFHLELAVVSGDPEPLGDLIRAIRGKLDKNLFLSASLPRDLLQHDGAKDFVEHLDFVVVLLYGQRSEEIEIPSAWDFQRVEQGAKLLEALGKPYLVGVSILGSTALIDHGRVIETSTKISLGDLVRTRGLVVEHGFTLEGIDRQVYSFRAEQAARVGPFLVREGQRVRLVRCSTPHMEELTRLFGAWNLPHRLGELYVRMPGPNEAAGLAVENLVNALGPSPIMPEPEVTVESLVPARGSMRLRISLENKAPEPTDLGFVDHNFVELVASDAYWDEVDPGNFPRFDLLKPNRSGELQRSLQSPTVLRLYVPLLEAGQKYQTGVVELTPTEIDPRILVGAEFLVPSGRSASFGPREWRLRR